MVAGNSRPQQCARCEQKRPGVGGLAPGPAETAKSLPKCKNKAPIIVSSLKEVKSSSP